MRRVIPTSYSVMTGGDGPGGKNLRSWVIEVPNDWYLWTEIDRRDNSNDMNDRCATANFKISGVPNESFCFFRLWQTGGKHKRKYDITVTAVDIFGTPFVTEKVEKL